VAENITNKDRLREITDSIEQGIKDLFESDQYAQYLRTMSRFHKYSVNNTMLIYMQRPAATLVAGFNKWRDQFERNVKKGEHGIKIIAPTPFRRKREQGKIDPITHAPVLDKDGNVVTEEVEIKIPMYKPVMVFDISQTEGKPLPQLASDLTGDVRQYEIFMEALRRVSPVPISIEIMTASMDGYFDTEHQDIAIRKGMSEIQTVSATVHEIAHAKLHNYEKERLSVGDETKEQPKPKDRRTEEVEAESISFAVCAYYGIQTGENSFSYIASWSKDKELPELRASLETINKTASDLITDIDRNYHDIMKERGLDKAEPEQPDETPLGGGGITEVTVKQYDPDAPLPPISGDYPMPDPTLTIADRDAYGYTENDMLPLAKACAIEFLDKDLTVYMLYSGNGARMAFDRDDIDGHIGLFGIKREEWDEARKYLELTAGRELKDQELEDSFFNNPADAFAIYQLRESEDLRDIRFEPLSWLESRGKAVEHDNYNLIYTAPLTQQGGTVERLESLWYQLNNDIPDDFPGHSLSVSDIVALKQGSKISCHYIDSFEFQELLDFLQPEHYLKNAEMETEDDFGMIDGIINNGPKATIAVLEQQAKSGQSISLMDLAAAAHRERNSGRKEKKSSVLTQLRGYQRKETTNIAPTRSAEREL
jgi:antirestriction protein ArdC